MQYRLTGRSAKVVAVATCLPGRGSKALPLASAPQSTCLLILKQLVWRTSLHLRECVFRPFITRGGVMASAARQTFIQVRDGSASKHCRFSLSDEIQKLKFIWNIINIKLMHQMSSVADFPPFTLRFINIWLPVIAPLNRHCTLPNMEVYCKKNADFHP